jgi:hypothetical protein
MTDARPLWCPPEVVGANWFGHLAGALGWPYTDDLLIGIRGVSLFADDTHETVARPEYDDTFVFLKPGSAMPPWLFKGSTHAYQTDSKLSPDIDGDGRGDVGTIRPGRYVLTLAITQPFPIYTLTMPDGSGRIPCFRDTNHDGRYSAEEIARQSFATAVLLHTGYDAPAESAHHSSIACQTCNASDLRTLAGLGGKTIDYILCGADEAIEIMKAAPYGGRVGA